jgi:ADP-ribosyl-[dinitrogen reductase] hydrolase
MTVSKDDKIKGSLLGKAWGDVLGCPIETWRDNQIREVYGSYSDLPQEYPFEKISKYGKSLSRLRPIGLHSDDTQQAMALVNICLSNGGWSIEKWAKYLVLGMDSGSWRGFGQFFSNAVHNLKKKVVPQKSGSDSAGIGTAMRITALAGVYHDDIEQLRKVVLESCLVTHAEIRSAAYSYAVAWTTAQFINGKSIEDIIKELPDATKVAEDEIYASKGPYKDWKISKDARNQVSMTMKKLFSQPINDISQTRKRITELAKPHLAEGFTKAHPNQGFVLTGGLHALVMSLQNMEPNEILLSIVREGYDTDTVAAIAGGILGARFGVDWIPTDRFYDKERLKKYANSMVKKESPESQTDFIMNERVLTKAEKDYQMSIRNKF